MESSRKANTGAFMEGSVRENGGSIYGMYSKTADVESSKESRDFGV